MTSVAFCPNCSARIERDVTVCGICGARFGNDAAWKPTAKPVGAKTEWPGRRHLVFGLIVGVALFILAWPIGHPESPLSELMLVHPRLHGFVSFISAPAVVLAAVTSGSGHGGGGDVFLFGVFVEGVIAGILFSLGVARFRKVVKTKDL